MFRQYRSVATDDDDKSDNISTGANDPAPVTMARTNVARPDVPMYMNDPGPNFVSPAPPTNVFYGANTAPYEPSQPGLTHTATAPVTNIARSDTFGNTVPSYQQSYQQPPERPGQHAHFQTSSSIIQSLHDEWNEFIHPNGSLYWTCSTQEVRVVSDIKPPLSNIPSASATIARLMHALVEIPQIDDYQNWEIYTDGKSCVYIDHGSRAASDTAQSLEQFKHQIQRLRGNLDITTKLGLEAAYWTFMQSHPNHRELPEGALEDATEALVWCHADRVLFKASNAPFSKEDAQEMTDLIKTISDLKRPTLKTWYCAAVMRAISQDRLASHYGQNDAREVRRKERADDVTSTLPFDSKWDWIGWHLVASMSLGSPLGYLKRINNVDRTTTGEGVNTLRWRAFLKSLCQEWTDTNLLATVLVSATVSLLAIPGLNGMAQIAGILSVLCATTSVLCGMILIFNHQDRIESSGGAGILYFKQVKIRGTGTTRPLAVILGLPLSLMLWGMFWFIFAIISCAYSSGLPISHQYFVATRGVALAFVFMLAIVGMVVVYFFYGIWHSQSARTAKPKPSEAHPVSTAIKMVTGQGGNPMMQMSGDQRLEPGTFMSVLEPVQTGRPQQGLYPPPQPYGPAYHTPWDVQRPPRNISTQSEAEPVVHRPPNAPAPPQWNTQQTSRNISVQSEAEPVVHRPAAAPVPYSSYSLAPPYSTIPEYTAPSVYSTRPGTPYPVTVTGKPEL